MKKEYIVSNVVPFMKFISKWEEILITLEDVFAGLAFCIIPKYFSSSCSKGKGVQKYFILLVAASTFSYHIG